MRYFTIPVSPRALGSEVKKCCPLFETLLLIHVYLSNGAVLYNNIITVEPLRLGPLGERGKWSLQRGGPYGEVRV